jgi:hypothetical protein
MAAATSGLELPAKKADFFSLMVNVSRCCADQNTVLKITTLATLATIGNYEFFLGGMFGDEKNLATDSCETL